MSVKKLLLLLSAGLATIGMSVAMAGGPEPLTPTAPPEVPGFQPTIYLDGNLGYAVMDWKEFNSVSGPVPFDRITSNSSGGFTFGGDVGYQFAKYFGAEVGAYYLPRVKGRASDFDPFVFDKELRVNSWFAYFAGKIVVPVFDCIDLFGKIGVAYRHINFSGPGIDDGVSRSNDYWRPMFAAGGIYHINENWSVNAQYIRMPGYVHSHPLTRRSPPADLFTLGIGYQFAV
jgi:OmpA-OmpF porin, OOP family